MTTPYSSACGEHSWNGNSTVHNLASIFFCLKSKPAYLRRIWMRNCPKTAFLEVWNRIPPTFIDNLNASIKNRCVTIIIVCGYHISYSLHPLKTVLKLVTLTFSPCSWHHFKRNQILNTWCFGVLFHTLIYVFYYL